MEIVALLTAFGFGSVITACIQYFLTTRSAAKRRTYDERKEAYIGLAEAWRQQEQDGISSKNKLEVGHWLLRCELVAPPQMLPILKDWTDAEIGSSGKMKATDQLKAAMRRDLSNFR
jgi:hypothetical protein